MPKVSVIIPTYNGEKFIEKSINSVLEQSISDLELIIIDDGSTDGTAQLIKKIAEKDDRVKLVLRKMASGGPTIPKNHALSLVESQYVCFLDHDDYYHPKKLEEMCNGMDKHPEWVAAFHDVQLVDADGKEFSGTYLSNANFLKIASHYMRPLEDNWFHCGEDFYKFMSLYYAAMHTDSVIIAPYKLLADPVSFRLRFRGSDDTDLWLRIGSQGPIGYLNSTLSYYRQHASNLSSDTLRMTENAIELHQSNYLQAKNRFDENELKKYRKKINSYKLYLGYIFYKEGKHLKSIRTYTETMLNGHLIRGFKGAIKSTLFYIFQK